MRHDPAAGARDRDSGDRDADRRQPRASSPTAAIAATTPRPTTSSRSISRARDTASPRPSSGAAPPLRGRARDWTLQGRASHGPKSPCGDPRRRRQRRPRRRRIQLQTTARMAGSVVVHNLGPTQRRDQSPSPAQTRLTAFFTDDRPARRCQAENPLTDLSRFAGPALSELQGKRQIACSFFALPQKANGS